MKIVIPFLLLAFAGLLMISFGPSDPETTATLPNSAEIAGVESAVLDYVEGIYDVKPERIERSVSKDLIKYGYWRDSADEDYRGSAMTYEQLHKLAGSWNVDNKRKVSDSTPKEIVVLDVLDQTAAAKLTAHWGIDYFQLEKVGGKWMIRHVMWQAHP